MQHSMVNYSRRLENTENGIRIFEMLNNCEGLKSSIRNNAIEFANQHAKLSLEQQNELLNKLITEKNNLACKISTLRSRNSK